MAVGRVRALVAGLGECGTREDVDVLSPFLEHPSPRVRAEAVRAVRRLGGSATQIVGMRGSPRLFRPMPREVGQEHRDDVVDDR